jgi:hypothetical protein
MAPLPRAPAQKVPTDIGILGSPDGPVYPLKASANNRYLVDQNNTPFLMVGDSPQQLITNLSQKEAAAFIGQSSKLWHQHALDQSALHLQGGKDF